MAEKVQEFKIKLEAGEFSALKEIRKIVLQLAAPPQLVQFSYHWRNFYVMHTYICPQSIHDPFYMIDMVFISSLRQFVFLLQTLG